MTEAQTTPRPETIRSDQSAIAQIVAMHPRKVMVSLKFPAVKNPAHQHAVQLEWSSEDNTMPLTELLQRIEAYVAKYGEF